MYNNHLNHVCLFKGEMWYVFERLGKQIPFDLYPINRHLGKGISPDEAISNSVVPSYDIEVIS